MARVALDERSADLADLTRWRSLAEELAEALKEANGSFCGSPQSQLRIDKALARFRDAANPASGAAITPEIHRKEEEANASRLKFLQAEGWCWTNEQIDRYRQIVRERRNDPTL